MTGDIFELLTHCTGFEWDAGNASKVWARHAVTQGECEQPFFVEPFLVATDEKHSSRERKWYGLGRTTAGRHLHFVFTIRGELIRVISARDMNRKERQRYGQTETSSEEDSEL